jgi:CHAT domain-containing protein
MHYLPVHALRHAGRYVFEDHEIYYLPSASTIAYLEAKRSKATAPAVLIVANPDNSLQFADQEATDVLAILGKGLILRRDADELAVTRRANNYGILHFATHGRLNAPNPMESHLVLAKGDMLNVAEIYGLDLRARLVTLSACNTNLGQMSSGDEFISLTRAFLFAGAVAVATTLWEADEASTPRLMSLFYSQLRQGRSTSAALRSAMASLSGESAFAHPYYWAPFVLVGDPN